MLHTHARQPPSNTTRPQQTGKQKNQPSKPGFNGKDEKQDIKKVTNQRDEAEKQRIEIYLVIKQEQTN